MTLGRKVVLVGMVPTCVLAGFAAVTFFSMQRTAGVVDHSTQQTFMPIISNDMPKMNALSHGIATLLNADRDGYQAMVAGQSSTMTTDAKALAGITKDCLENIDQVAERISQAAPCFDDGMKKSQLKFNEAFPQWKSATTAAVNASVAMASSSVEQDKLMAIGVKQFEAMRDCIDEISTLLEEQIASAHKANDLPKLAMYNDSYGLLINADRDAYQSHVALLKMRNCWDPKALTAYEKDEIENAGQIAERMVKSAVNFDDPMKAAQKKFNGMYTQWRGTAQKITGLAKKNAAMYVARDEQIAVGTAMFAKMRSTIDEIDNQLEQAIKDQMAASEKASETAAAENESLMADLRRTSWTMLAISGVMVLVVLAISVLVARSVVKSLKTIIVGLGDGAGNVNDAASQVSGSSQRMAEGASEQAASVEETSASLEEMASTTKINSESAERASQLASQTNAAAITGSQAMTRMSQAIEEISKAAGETSKIIKVIDEIAFQTNLLALNAAVEAARAGEAGKGFAVVAEEVRNLAMRSAEAAKNTSAMIEGSVKSAHRGVELTQEVAKQLNEITGAVGQTAELVSGMAKANKEQSQGIEEVNKAMTQIDKVTQNNAASAEEIASSAEELSAQAIQMNSLVSDLVALVGGTAQQKMKQVRRKTAAKGGHSPKHAAASSDDSAQQDQADEQAALQEW